MTSPKPASVVVPLVPLDGVDDVWLVRGDVDFDADPAMSHDDQIRHGFLVFEALMYMASGTPTKSEVVGFGAGEIVPWRMGAVM